MLPTQIRTTPDNLILPRVLSTQPTITLHKSLFIKTPLQKDSNFIQIRQKRLHFTCGLFRKPDSGQSSDGSAPVTTQEDFVTRVLKENPSQVEPKYKIGDKLYTLKEKEDLGKKGYNGNNGIFEIVKKLNLKGLNGDNNNDRGGDGVGYSHDVHLNDILRKFKGKLYVPEQIFVEELSEEDVFDREFETLPRMSFDDLGKAIRSGMVKFMTFKDDDRVAYGNKDFIVELKAIPGDKSLQRTKWSVKLDGVQVQDVLKEYNGPRYEIETQTMAWVGKVPQYPDPVASTISSRVMVELGAVTAAIAAAAVVVGGFLASAAVAVTSFVYVGTVYAIWPIAKSFLTVPLDVAVNVLERMGDVILDMFIYGGITSKFQEMYSFGIFSSAFKIARPMLLVGVCMVILLRFTLSRRPKNFRKWDIWQGIEFSQSKPQARVDGSTGVTFADVAGIEIAVEELQELVKYLKNPELFDKMGIKPPHGVLLEGPPGCGKTLVAKAIAGEAGVPFYQMAGSEFVEVLVGVGSARIRDLFKRAKVNKPSVIFIDEIDALATRRQGIFSDKTDDLYNAATQERETTLNQLLIELDGFDTGKGVIFLGATNRKDLLDPALLRPGRFDRKIRIRPPNAKGRLEILQVHARKVKLSESVDLSVFAQNLPGWSGARLAQLLQEAALVAVRNKHKSILQSDVAEAVDRLTVGPKRVALDLGHQGQCRRATSEVGTALTSHLIRRLENAAVEPCDRISIYPRGQTLSQVVFNRLDDEKYLFERRPQLLHRLQVLLGGRAAEEVIFGRDTSKASVNYLADATWLARKIITIWNLDNPMVIHGEPPPWRRQPKFVGPRLDFEESLYDDYGLIEPPINFNMDDEIARRTEELISNTYGKTVALLRRHHTALLKTVKVLLRQMEMTGDEIDYILEKYPPNTPTSRLLEEGDPGSLSFFKQKQGQDVELEYSILNQ
ncbi:putative peptidase M41, AAA+ ATPase domain, ATPase, AAA-type, core [Helianthus annuus]|uniref:Peptidase M41, AAA+ ATPase domain, ATPase, AAA-type, core n=1 Tax=Helianthus annuus TaxID=4232 RepID=A0A251SVK4_HELAN|nr:probable inactive ATP-dependent zinc metalloprotease FTSHI 1, chloroplastic [Helianthus annuus]KAF5774722.1 putative peptidase M41, AAA+ ATPase domain, ATPase, AAA-type, core [Helianthus annuus]KAJ0478014.1 putative peptidase M41, AAA+ ATPase domain, ATPase, AAA-type, core [Helianthus annuus]KAJ0498871.1 putative peptidase M41, AAA+ ATPase domain, ATPase, AAA-type, core [Helianthus annuus]KAJ0664886.1 putative peptidase M41, AAA+ ATPase domain, ATPase, AAA-type, core [Helianthus annuus]KAJ0